MKKSSAQLISFYPGPSRVYDQIPAYVRDASKLGIMSINHRSDAFVSISKKTTRLLQQRLRIPKEYKILFTSSATECWEIIAQSLVTSGSMHIFNGAFGEKWYEYTRRINSGAASYHFNREEIIDPAIAEFALKDGVICITQNETSNGTQVSNDIINSIRKKSESNLVAVDATSSMAGIYLQFESADIWFASVQKCFGLPAGMGIMVLSPKAVQRSRQINERSHYNSLSFMLDMSEKWQTSFTPNVINIYLLMRTLEKSAPIRSINKLIHDRYNDWMEFLQNRKFISHLVDNEEARSVTVLPIKTEPELISKIKKDCLKQNILVGEGYGELKAGTFRIANFPAIRDAEIRALKKVLFKY